MKKIKIMEVGLRDGLQVVSQTIPLKEKLFLVNGLINSGIKNIQVGSFVNPKKVPQMLNIDDFVKQLPDRHDIEYSALVFNVQGVERALQLGIKKIETSVSVSQTYNKKNLGMSTSKSLKNLKSIIEIGMKNNLQIRAGLQCVWGCPYDGRVKQELIIKNLSSILEMGVNKIALCDTSGMADPQSISVLLESIFKFFPDIYLCMHFHNTQGVGLVNLFQALKFNIMEIDTSFGGIGGSPFIKSSGGNISTEDTVNMLESMGYRTGIDIKKVARLSQNLERKIGKSYFSGQLYKSL